MLKNPGALRSGIFVQKPSAQLTEAPRKSSRFRYRAKRAAESGLTAPYEFSCYGGGGSEQGSARPEKFSRNRSLWGRIKQDVSPGIMTVHSSVLRLIKISLAAAPDEEPCRQAAPPVLKALAGFPREKERDDRKKEGLVHPLHGSSRHKTAGVPPQCFASGPELQGQISLVDAAKENYGEFQALRSV